MEEYEVTLNKIAQGALSYEEGLSWFLEKDESEQFEVLRDLNLCIHQSHPTELEIEEGIKESGLKETYTPCVIIRKNNLRNTRHKTLNLPSHEWEKTFRLWLCIFTLADTRRRQTDCKNGCHHWWHNLEKA